MSNVEIYKCQLCHKVGHIASFCFRYKRKNSINFLTKNVESKYKSRLLNCAYCKAHGHHINTCIKKIKAEKRRESQSNNQLHNFAYFSQNNSYSIDNKIKKFSEINILIKEYCLITIKLIKFTHQFLKQENFYCSKSNSFLIILILLLIIRLCFLVSTTEIFVLIISAILFAFIGSPNHYFSDISLKNTQKNIMNT